MKPAIIKNSEINYLSLQIFISSFKSPTKFTLKLYILLVGNNKPIQIVPVAVLFLIQIHYILPFYVAIWEIIN